MTKNINLLKEYFGLEKNGSDHELIIKI